MTLNIDLRHLMHHRNAALPQVDWATPREQQASSVTPSSVVNISSAGIAKASQSAAETQGTAASVQAPNALREELKKYDFTSATPSQIRQLAWDLFDKKEISENAFNALVGIETDTVKEADSNKPMNIVRHFDWMLSTVSDAAQSDSTLSFALQYRQEASSFLNDLISFASSDRKHISTSAG